MPRRAASWGAFVAWIGVGAGFVFAFLSILSIGIFVFPLVVVLTALLASWSTTSRGAPGLISGMGLPLLLVAFLNRDGPGYVCSHSQYAANCMQEWNPLPWLGAGIGVILLGVAIFVLVRRRNRTQDAAATQWYAHWSEQRPPWSDGRRLG